MPSKKLSFRFFCLKALSTSQAQQITKDCEKKKHPTQYQIYLTGRELFSFEVTSVTC